MDVLMFAADCHHLPGPGIADMATDDDQLGKIKCHLIHVRDRSARVGWHQRAGVADLGAERDFQLDTGCKQGIETTVGRRGLPEPGKHPEALEAIIGHPAPEFTHGFHRL